MNISGSDVSKEAAAMILMDDNFASTVSGIEEGRLIFVNLKKSIQYTITHTMPEVWANLLYILIPIPVPLTTILIILIDLGFELAPGLSFAWDPPENRAGMMKLPPRKPVSKESIARLRTLQAHSAEMSAKRRMVDEETGDDVAPTWRHKVHYWFEDKWHALKQWFSLTAWKRKFESTDDEVLVDANIMSWAYLEIGSLEAIACFTTFFVTLWYAERITPYDMQQFGRDQTNNPFSPTTSAPATVPSTGKTYSESEQLDVYGQGQSMFYLTLCICQLFNMFMVKARMGYPFGKFMLTNWRTFGAIVVAVGLAMIFVYVPGIDTGLKTSRNTPPLMWLLSLAFGCLIMGYVCLRIFIIRRHMPLKFTSDVVGLQMYPTKWSTRNSGK